MENGIDDKRQKCNQYNNLVTAEYCHEVTGCSSFSVSRKLQAASYELTVFSFISKESSVAHKFSSVNTYLWNYLSVDKLTTMLIQVEIITIYMHILFEFRYNVYCNNGTKQYFAEATFQIMNDTLQQTQ